MKKYGGAGFTGGVRVWTGDPVVPPPEFKTVGDPITAAQVLAQTPPLGAARIADLRNAIADNLYADPPRRPRHRWLRWLFNLISTES